MQTRRQITLQYW